jgi:hypothetical protein
MTARLVGETRHQLPFQRSSNRRKINALTYRAASRDRTAAVNRQNEK